MRSVAILAALTIALPLWARQPVPPATPIGPAVNCVNIRNIRNTNVIDNQTIDFVMNGRQTFRNTLPIACPQLGFERAFAYQTSTSQLCSVDIITVIV
ncbi:MAG: hypothetical protein H7267_04415, partial [Sandarakinorhabdus sp.]|nr:hypothetical protein [Sandarakinorhabdus sp.]